MALADGRRGFPRCCRAPGREPRGAPRRVLAAWGVLVILALGLVAKLLGSGLTSDGTVRNNPESYRAQKLIDERFPDRDAVDDDNAAVVRALFDAFNDGDLAQALATVTEDFQLIDLAAGQTFTPPTGVVGG
jgi:hypothetical protein